MRVAILFEQWGVVRDAFLALGHDAVSCDLEDTQTPGPHIRADVRRVDWSPYDLIIAHPPCTYLCSSGLHWNKRRPERKALTEQALLMVGWVMDLPCPQIVIENPVGCISTRFQKPDQIIQPWQFGHAESKTTCLWLQGVPKLRPTNTLPKPACGYWSNQTPSGQNKMGPSPHRSILRARTYEGIADAMARQWGGVAVAAESHAA